MKGFFILLTLACFCHITPTQSDDSYSGLGHLKPRIEQKVRNCGQLWVTGCYEGVTRPRTGYCQCAPVFGFSAEQIQTFRLGGTAILYSVFYGYPIPSILWKGPQNSLPAGRYTLTNYDTTLILNGITVSDEGTYNCSGSNIFGGSSHSLQIRVVAAPEFRNKTDVPYNVTVTEGESVTFNCNPFAIPEANIVWFLNEQPIDTDNSSTRFVISDDNKNLTIRDVCRDCVDRESKTDLMVIQCNASNVHGYAFASGYLNVLIKTKVTIRGPDNVSVDFLEEMRFVFQCIVTSDPSTPATVRWYRTEPFGDLVRDEPPYVNVTNEFLIITIDSNCFDECAKYFGEYRCVADNGYSRDNRTITLPYVGRHRPTPEANRQKEESWAVWKTVSAAAAIGAGLLLVGIFLCFRSKQSSGDVKRRMTEGNRPNTRNIYDDIGDDSVGPPLEELSADKEESMTRERSMYDHIGYDSIGQVLNEIAQKEEVMLNSSDVHGDKGYESIDAPEKEAISRSMLDEDIKCDDMGYSIPSGDVTNGGEIDQHQVHGYESVTSESEKCQKSNEQSEALNSDSVLNGEEVNPRLDPGKSELDPKKVNSYLDLVSKEVNPYLDLVSKEVNPYLDLVSKEVNPYLDLVSKEVNPYLDLVSTEANPYLDLVSKEVDPYLNLGPKELNQSLDLGPNKVNQKMDLGPKDLDPHWDSDPNLDKRATEANPYLDLGLKKVVP